MQKIKPMLKKDFPKESILFWLSKEICFKLRGGKMNKELKKEIMNKEWHETFKKDIITLKKQINLVHESLKELVQYKELCPDTIKKLNTKFKYSWDK